MSVTNKFRDTTVYGSLINSTSAANSLYARAQFDGNVVVSGTLTCAGSLNVGPTIIANYGNIASAQTGVATHTSQLSAIYGNVAAQQTTTGTLTTQVNAVYGNVAAQQSTTGTHTAQINAIYGNVAAQQATTGTLTTQINAIYGNVTTQQATTGTLTTQINAIYGNVTTQQATAGTLTQITAIYGNVTTQQATTGTHTTQINAIYGNVTTQQATTGTLTTQINAIYGNVTTQQATTGTHTTQINAIYGNVATQQSTTGIHTTQINAIYGNVTTQQATTGTHTTQINAIYGNVTTQQATTGTLTTQINAVYGNVTALQAINITGYLPLAGGTMTGKLTINETSGTEVAATATGANASLVLQHQNAGGVSTIAFPSKSNPGSDMGYIRYIDNYAATSNNTEDCRLIIGVENDPTNSGPDSIALMSCSGVGGATGSGCVLINKLTPTNNTNTYSLDVYGSANIDSNLQIGGTLTSTGLTSIGNGALSTDNGKVIFNSHYANASFYQTLSGTGDQSWWNHNRGANGGDVNWNYGTTNSNFNILNGTLNVSGPASFLGDANFTQTITGTVSGSVVTSTITGSSFTLDGYGLSNTYILFFSYLNTSITINLPGVCDTKYHGMQITIRNTAQSSSSFTCTFVQGNLRYLCPYNSSSYITTNIIATNWKSSTFVLRVGGDGGTVWIEINRV